MRILVCGGRTFWNRQTVWHELGLLAETHGWLTIINGGAAGADQCAREWARNNYHGLVAIPADWATHKNFAGPIRNQLMIDAGKPDLGFAFPGKTGTADMCARLLAHNIPLIDRRPS